MSPRLFQTCTCEWNITAGSRAGASIEGVHRGPASTLRAEYCPPDKKGGGGTRNSPNPGWSPQSAVRPAGRQNTAGGRISLPPPPLRAKGGAAAAGSSSGTTLHERRLAGTADILSEGGGCGELLSLPVPISLSPAPRQHTSR